MFYALFDYWHKPWVCYCYEINMANHRRDRNINFWKDQIRAYQFGYAQSVPYVNSLLKEKKYDAVIIDTPHAQPHIFYLFFSKYSPREYQNEIK